MQDMELIIFEIISNGGNAKALVYEAMEESEKPATSPPQMTKGHLKSI